MSTTAPSSAGISGTSSNFSSIASVVALFYATALIGAEFAFSAAAVEQFIEAFSGPIWPLRIAFALATIGAIAYCVFQMTRRNGFNYSN